MKKERILYELNNALLPIKHIDLLFSTRKNLLADNLGNNDTKSNYRYNIEIDNNSLTFTPDSNGNVETAEDLKQLVENIQSDEVAIKCQGREFKSILPTGKTFTFILEDVDLHKYNL